MSEVPALERSAVQPSIGGDVPPVCSQLRNWRLRPSSYAGCQLPTSGEPPLTTRVRHHRGGWPGSTAPRALVPLPANRSAALAGHEHHTFKDRGEVAGGAYNHKTMPDWRVKRHRSVMNRRADHIERNASENQPHYRRRHGY